MPQTNIIKIRSVLLLTLHIRRILHIISRKSWYSMLMVMGNSKICVYLFAILLKLWKFDAREIYMFYSKHWDILQQHTHNQTSTADHLFLSSTSSSAMPTQLWSNMLQQLATSVVQVTLWRCVNSSLVIFSLLLCQERRFLLTHAIFTLLQRHLCTVPPATNGSLRVITIFNVLHRTKSTYTNES